MRLKVGGLKMGCRLYLKSLMQYTNRDLQMPRLLKADQWCQRKEKDRLISNTKPDVTLIEGNSTAELIQQTKSKHEKKPHADSVTVNQRNPMAELIQQTKSKPKKKPREDSRVQHIESQVSDLQSKLSEALDTVTSIKKQEAEKVSKITDLQSNLHRAKTIIENPMTAV
jgi:chromosome segregation ATPase